MINGLIKIDVYLLERFFFFNRILLTTLMALLPVSCGQEALFSPDGTKQ